MQRMSMTKSTSWLGMAALCMMVSVAATAAPASDPEESDVPFKVQPSAAAKITTASGETEVPFKVPALSAILGDLDSGAVLYAQDAEVRREPASLTKVMTLYLIYEALANNELRLDDQLPVSERAWRLQGSKTFVQVGEQVRVEDLIRGIAVQSGNDACMVVAEHLAGSEEGFAELMNKKARELGMKDSHFMNASGLPDPNHYTTALDLFKLASALERRFPKFSHYSAEKQFTYNNIRQVNRNRLLWRDPAITGLKTGHTQTAGYCLIATNDKDGQRMGSVILGAASRKIREEEALRLMAWGKRQYETVRLVEANASIRKLRVWKGESQELDSTVREAVVLTVSRKEKDKLEMGLQYQEPLVAPIEVGQQVGTLVVKLAGKELLQRPLVAVKAVAPGGFITRMVDTVRLAVGW